MDYLPIFADVRKRRVLVVGGGPAADAKIRLVRQAGAEVVVRAAGEFTPADVKGCVAVFGATGDGLADRRVAEAAHAAGVAVNIVDRPELSSFIMPAIVDRSPVVIAISSGGRSPVLARRLREHIEAMLPVRIDELARFAGRFRGAVRALLPDLGRRRKFWERFFDSPLADKVLDGKPGVDAEMIALINRRVAPADRPRVAVRRVAI